MAKGLRDDRTAKMILILLLVVIIFAAVAAQFLFHPDRKATIQLIYTGDILGNVSYEQGKYAGYEKIAAVRQDAEKNGANTFLIDVGNCLGGSETAEFDKGASIIGLMNDVGYDLLVPGSVDFVYGASELAALRSEAGFPFLAANVSRSDGMQLLGNYQIFNAGQIRMAVIGVTDGIGSAAAGREGLTVSDPAETVETIIAQIRDQADIIVVAASIGDEEMIRRIAALDHVNLVIESGHIEAAEDEAKDGTLIVSAGRDAAVIGKVTLSLERDDLTVKNEKVEAETYDALPSDETARTAVEEFMRVKDKADSEVLGSITLKTFSEETESPGETAVGDLVADAMLAEAKKDGAEAALITDSAIHGTLRSGTVTRGQTAGLFDDSLYMIVCRMTGGELRRILEDSFHGYPDAEGFLQVAGLYYTYNRGTAIGSTLSDIQVGSHDLDDARLYTVAMTDVMGRDLGYVSESSGLISTCRCMGTIVADSIMSSAALFPADETAAETEETEEGSDLRIRIR